MTRAKIHMFHYKDMFSYLDSSFICDEDDESCDFFSDFIDSSEFLEAVTKYIKDKEIPIQEGDVIDYDDFSQFTEITHFGKHYWYNNSVIKSFYMEDHDYPFAPPEIYYPKFSICHLTDAKKYINYAPCIWIEYETHKKICEKINYSNTDGYEYIELEDEDKVHHIPLYEEMIEDISRHEDEDEDISSTISYDFERKVYFDSKNNKDLFRYNFDYLTVVNHDGVKVVRYHMTKEFDPY